MLVALAAEVEMLTAVLPASWKGLWAHLRGALLAAYGLKLPSNTRICFRALLHPSRFESEALRHLPPADMVLTRSPHAALALSERYHHVLLESHDPIRDDAKVGLRRLAQTLSHKRHGLVAISHAVAQRYLEAGFASTRILVAPDAVDCYRFTSARGGGLVRLFGPKVMQKPTILYAGSLQPGKGARFLARLAPQIPEVHVVIVGGTEEELQSLGTAPNLFLHPAIPHAHIPNVLADATVLILPYTGTDRIAASMSPLKLYEALAAGKPIVAADLPVLREVLTPKTAFFFAPGDPDACRKALQRVLELTPDQQNALGAAAQHHVWTWQERAQRIVQWCPGGAEKIWEVTSGPSGQLP